MNIVILGCGNIGFETAKLLCEGNSVLLIDRFQPDYVGDYLRQHRNVLFAQADTTDPSRIREVFQSVFGENNHKVDALICTVGVPAASSAACDFNDFVEQFDANFFGNLIPIKTLLDLGTFARRLRIVVISSTSGHFSPPRLTAYAPSKWALENTCEALRNEMIPFGISVDIVCPRTLRNKYSKTFISERGISPEIVAKRVAKVIRRPQNSKHFVPRCYAFLHFVERLFPGFLDRIYGMGSRQQRKNVFRKYETSSVLITGATSSLGKNLVLMYAKVAKTLYLVARNRKALLKIQEEHLGDSECNVETASVDIGNLDTLLNYIMNLNQVDIVINNAASRRYGFVRDVSIDDYKKCFATNFFGPVLLMLELLKKESKPKKIVNILSTTAVAGRKMSNPYSATKAALWTFTRSVRRTYGRNVQVLEVLPSTFYSNYDSTLRYSGEKSQRKGRLLFEVLRAEGLTAKRVAEEIFKKERQGGEIVMAPKRTRLFIALEGFFPSLFRKLFD